MPRRNRNAGTPRLDTDQLAADLVQVAADLRPDTWTTATPGTARAAVPARCLTSYLARFDQARYLPAVTGGTQHTRQLATESR
jgi:hypothetical protein